MFEKMERINRVKTLERLLDVKNLYKPAKKQNSTEKDEIKDKKIIERVIENWD
jgi:hypothetical protein